MRCLSAAAEAPVDLVVAEAAVAAAMAVAEAAAVADVAVAAADDPRPNRRDKPPSPESVCDEALRRTARGRFPLGTCPVFVSTS